MKRIFAAAAALLACGFLLLSCASGRDSQRGGPGSQAEMSLFKLKGLVSDTTLEASLRVTATQAGSLLPLLKDWQTRLTNLSESDAQAYANQVESLLTDGQKNYRPQPPQGRPGNGVPGGEGGNGPGGPGGDQGGPGAGGPGFGGPGSSKAGGMVDRILTELIDALSKVH